MPYSIIISRIRFIMGGGRLLSGGDLNMDVFFCLLTGIWACNCGVGGLGAYGGGGGSL